MGRRRWGEGLTPTGSHSEQMFDHDQTIIPGDNRAPDARGSSPPAPTPGAGAAADVSRIAETIAVRYRDARAEGQTLSIDALVDSADDGIDRDTLRSSVMALLAADGDATIRSSSPRRPDGAEADAAMPAIEGYALVRALGQGGMGAVYEAIQQSTGRRVAIKFMLDAVSASESARRRFELEVEVVARLNHPGVVAIIDSGVRRGRYYYVMEYVEGRSLDAALPRGRADIRRVLTVIADICDAVDAAHQRGVLHRDLKPGNIIIGEDDRPHLLDFGLAKTLDTEPEGGGEHGRLGLTVSGPGQLLGTVAYMSPEQAQGRHDETSVRTDVYALGAIAYETVTGRLPCLGQGSLHDVLARIIAEDPPAPSTIRAEASRDLDAVLLRALEKEPAKRYPTVGEFAAELRRVLAGEPVLARRISPVGRGWRWVRRNRAISLTATIALATIVVVSAVLVARIMRESRIAAFERDIARENFDRLRMILESADPERSPGGVTVMQLLDAASRALDDAPPERELAEAQIREVLGNVYRKLGEYGKARVHQAKALTIREELADGREESSLADGLHNLAATLWWDGDYAQAETLYARSLAMRRVLFGGAHRDVATSLTHLAACRLRMGKLNEARTMYEEALAMRRRIYGAEHEEIAQSLNNLAKCLLDADDFRRAEDLHREALAMITRLRGDGFVGTAAASQNLAECLLRRSTADEIAGDDGGATAAATAARDAAELALRIRTETFTSGHHLIGASLNALARAELRLGNVERAGTLVREALAMVRQTRRDDHPDLVAVFETLGTVLLAEGDPVAAAEAFDEAIVIGAHIRPPADVQIAQLQGELGVALTQVAGTADQVNEELIVAAESLLIDSLEHLRRLRGDASVDTAVAARRLVAHLLARGDTDRAAMYRSYARIPDAASGVE